MRVRELDSSPPAEAVRPELDPFTSFEAFYEQELVWALRLAFVFVPKPEPARDIVQESFLRLHPRFEQLDNPRAYLRVTIVNLCRHHRGAEARRRDVERSLVAEVQVSAPSVELLDLIDRLPKRQKAVLVLRYYEDLSEKDIADVLGCRPGTVKSLAARALERLRKELTHD